MASGKLILRPLHQANDGTPYCQYFHESSLTATLHHLLLKGLFLAQIFLRQSIVPRISFEIAYTSLYSDKRPYQANL